jgi:4-amino-4-deoxy-L-arabinose transferase-like glycosyltransferase
MVIKNKIKRYFELYQFELFIFTIFLGGVFIRLYQLDWRSFWLDEAGLANILVKDNIKQIFNINHYSKGAPFPPPIFTIILHFISKIVEPNEFNLRILPAFSGILCLPLIYILTKRFFDRYTASIALFLCSFNSLFIFFSRELKQYTTEALFTLLAIYLAEKVMENDNKRTFLLFIIICILSFGFSHSFVFTLPVISIFVYLKLIEKSSHYSSLALLNLIFGLISFSLYYILFIRNYISDALIEYWAHSYVDYSSISNIFWWHYSKAYLLLSYYCSFPKALGILHEIWIIIFLSILFLGIVTCYQRRSRFLIYLIGPLCLAYLAAWLQKYPVEPRTYLFILPLLLITLAVGLRRIQLILKERMVTSLLISLLFFFLACTYVFKPLYKYIIFYDKEYMRVEQLRPLLEQVKSQISDNDFVNIHPRASIAYEFYDNILNKKVIHGHINNLSFYDGNKRVWIIFTHLNEPQRKEYIKGINNERELLLTIFEPGASAYLFDLSTHY